MAITELDGAEDRLFQQQLFRWWICGGSKPRTGISWWSDPIGRLETGTLIRDINCRKVQNVTKVFSYRIVCQWPKLYWVATVTDANIINILTSTSLLFKRLWIESSCIVYVQCDAVKNVEFYYSLCCCVFPFRLIWWRLFC